MIVSIIFGYDIVSDSGTTAESTARRATPNRGIAGDVVIDDGDREIRADGNTTSAAPSGVPTDGVITDGTVDAKIDTPPWGEALPAIVLSLMVALPPPSRTIPPPSLTLPLLLIVL